MPTVPTTRYAILRVLESEGPLHTSAIAALLGRNNTTINSALRIAHSKDLVHITGWKRSLGTRGRWGPIWAAGRGYDRKPPQVDVHLEANVRYREKMREVIRRKTRQRRGAQSNMWLNILGTKT